ncbi:SDR family NAD(P)-dependent oxidoreductase [Amycolatopsis kentuckyensis]|uniref:SDR family NAD(P)-dependent oxidoreductase n=1 Tax=Amycolatopsis kentuckyensis TaxID=218823 RepID=UPI000A3C331C|nr:SDR family oxidoreductase [Amycolatopsis kentuckyensis]
MNVTETKSLAVEYATRNVRVNAVSPGIIRTPMHPARRTRPWPLFTRSGDPSDLVDAVVYLERAPFVTGEILHVDGGQSAGP